MIKGILTILGIHRSNPNEVYCPCGKVVPLEQSLYSKTLEMHFCCFKCWEKWAKEHKPLRPVWEEQIEHRKTIPYEC